jgi:hypothetical protein
MSKNFILFPRLADVLGLNQTTCLSSHIKILKELSSCSASDRERSSVGLMLNGLRPFERPPGVLVEDIGVEPMTLCLQSRCSSQLS